MNYGFAIDNRKCIGCHACTVACKSEHDVPIGVNRTHVKYIEKGRFPNNVRKFSVHRCNHCEDAPCVEICPTSALYTRKDGIVDFDNDRCIGCKSCMQACPYDALYIDPKTSTAAKCNYCSHRVDRGIEPACVVVCPVQAIVSGDLDDPNSNLAKLVAKQAVTVRKPEKNTKPNLYYVEGDDHMLDPTAVPRHNDYLWSEQTGGVGHFAKYAQQRLSEGLNRKVTGTVPSEVKSHDPRRVYDSPAKGVLWGWEVPAYLWTKAIAVGIFMMAWIHGWLGGDFSGETRVKVLVTSLVFLTLTAALLVKDLDKPGRFLYVLLRPNWSSWLVRGAYIITAFGLLVTAMLVGELTGKSMASLAIPTMISAVLGAVYTAFLLAQAKGRDLWQSPMASVHMLLHALLAGGVVLMILAPEADETVILFLRFALPFNLALIGLELVTPHVSKDAKTAVGMMLRGPYAPMFYMGIVLGNLVPMLLVFLVPVGPAMVLALGGLVLLGVLITEYVRVILPQLIPLS